MCALNLDETITRVEEDWVITARGGLPLLKLMETLRSYKTRGHQKMYKTAYWMQLDRKE